MTPEITSYTELIGAIHAEIQRLGVRSLDFDELAGFAPGLSGKVFGMLQVKRLGPEKLFDAIRAAGLRLRVEIDPEQQAKMIQRIADNFNPRQANQARNTNHASPVGTAVLSRVFKHMSRLGNEARKRKMSKEERAQSAKHAANARWKRHRKEQKRRARQRKRSHQAKKVAAALQTTA